MPYQDTYQPRHAGRSLEVEPRLDLDSRHSPRHGVDSHLVERMAEAIYRSEPGTDYRVSWDARGGMIQDSYRLQARAVLAVVREVAA